MRKIYLISILLFNVHLNAQTTIELEKKAANYFENSKKFRVSTIDSILIYAKKIEDLEVQTKSSKIEAYRKATLALFYLEKFQLNKAEENGMQALQVFEKLENQKQTAFLKSILGRIYQNRSDYVKASNYFFASNTIAKKYNFISIEIVNNKNLSFLFLDQKNIKKAFFYAHEAEKKAKIVQDKIELAFVKGILAEIYRSDNQIDKSQQYFKLAFELFSKLQLPYGKAWTLTNWSILESHGFEKSFRMRKEAQKNWNTIAPHNIMSIANQYNIGYDFLDLYQKGNKYKHIKEFDVSKKQLLDSTFFYINKSLQIAELENNTNWKMYCYGTLNEVYYYRNDLKKYSEFTNKYYFLKDSLFSQENKNKIAELESAKKIELRDREIKINKLLLEANQKQKWVYILGLGFLTILGGLLLYQNRKRKQINSKLETLNQNLDQANKTKLRFFSILNHDLRSPIANLIHFLHLQQDNPELLDEATKARMQDKTITGAENLLSSMEDILLWSKGQMENFKPQPKNLSVNQLFDDTKKVFSGYLKIKFEYINPNNIEIYSDENYLKTIIRNLTNNAINIFITTENPKIIWKAYQSENQTFLSITDNGPGATQEQFKALYDDTEVVGIKTGLGLHLIRDLAKAIDCEITVDSKINEGTTFVLKLK